MLWPAPPGRGSLLLGHGRIIIGLGRIEGRLGNDISFHQFRVSIQGPLRIDNRHLGLDEVGAVGLKTGLRIERPGPGVLKVRLGILKAGLGILHIGPSLLNLGIKDRRIDLGNHLVLLHLGIKIGIEGFDRPRNLASHQNRDHRD